jgi:hypothetical protein
MTKLTPKQQQKVLIDVIDALPDYFDFNISSVKTALNLWNSNDDLFNIYNNLDYNDEFSITYNISILLKVINILSSYLDDNIRDVEEALSLWSQDLLNNYKSIIL